LFLRLCVRGYRQRKKGAGEGEVLDGIPPQELRQDMQKIKNIEKMRLSSKCERVLLDHHLSESTKKVLEGWRRHKFSDF
jgi:hypothetical protein